jgi:hypothetical protein
MPSNNQPLVSWVVQSFLICQYADQLPQACFPHPDAGDKKFNSRLVAPTILQKKPFGENVEGLSHCGDDSYGPQIVFK